MQELHNMTTADNTGVSTRTPDTTFEEMLNAIGDSLSDLASSDDERTREDEEDDEEDTDLGRLSDDDETGWVVGTISKTVQRCMESFRQKNMRLEELTQPGCGDIANCFRERDMKCWTAEFKVPAIFKPQIDRTAATPYPTTFGELMQTLDIVCGKEQIPTVTSRPGSSQMRLGSEKPHTQTNTSSFAWCCVRFDTDSGWTACWTRKLLPLHEASLVNYHIEIGYGRRYGDGSRVTGGIDTWIVYLDNLSLVKQFVYLLCYVSAFSWFQWPHCKTWYFISVYARVVRAMQRF